MRVAIHSHTSNERRYKGINTNMKTVCSVVLVPARAQATCRRASVRNSSTRVSSARSSSTAFVGQNKTIHSLSKKSTTAVKAPSSNVGSSRSFSVVANAVVPTGDASPPPVVFNVSAEHSLSRSCILFFLLFPFEAFLLFLYDYVARALWFFRFYFFVFFLIDER